MREETKRRKETRSLPPRVGPLIRIVTNFAGYGTLSRDLTSQSRDLPCPRGVVDDVVSLWRQLQINKHGV